MIVLANVSEKGHRQLISYDGKDNLVQTTATSNIYEIHHKLINNTSVKKAEL